MKGKLNIIFAAKDQGGFDAMFPVINEFEKNNRFNLLVVLDSPSYKFAKKKGIKCLSATNLPISKINKIIKEINPDIVFTGTSRGFSIEKNFIAVAKREKIQTVSMVDYWGNYQQRFGKKLEYIPDYILAIDEEMKKQMVKEGIPKDRIFITGNPRFDVFSGFKRTEGNGNVVVFYSQPFSERNDTHFHEVKIFGDVIRALEAAYPQKEVVVKFHPSERRKGKFYSIIKNTRIKVTIEKRLEARDLNKKAGLVIGINSMALFDAVLMQKRVISYQPGMESGDDLLLSNRRGLSVSAYTENMLLLALKSIYKKPPASKKELEKYTKHNATKKVIRFLKKVHNKL